MANHRSRPMRTNQRDASIATVIAVRLQASMEVITSGSWLHLVVTESKPRVDVDLPNPIRSYDRDIAVPALVELVVKTRHVIGARHLPSSSHNAYAATS